MRKWALHALPALIFTALYACATLGTDDDSDINLPTAGVGPFRKLAPEEVKGLAPFVLEDPLADYREPAVLHDGDTTTTTIMFAVAKVTGRDVIVRTHATDERTFFGTDTQFGKKPLVVLTPSESWEGANLAGPTAYRSATSTDVLLFYSGTQGIGLARSTDGAMTFTKAGLVLGADTTSGTWEPEPPHSPTVYPLTDGRLRMFYTAGTMIGEAESKDGGASWLRIPQGPVLMPAPPAAPGSLLPNEKPPFDTTSVGDPCAVTRITPAGRFHVRVLYTGKNDSGTAIGFAARYGESGPLDRNPVPVYSVGLHEAAPALLDLGASSYLYVQQDHHDGTTAVFTAIAGAFAPANITLPASGDFPDAP